MTVVMFDTVTVETVPANPQAVAGYTSGFWPTYEPLVRRFPHAYHLSIAVTAGHDADCLDVEPGDATPDQAGPWAARQIARGVHRPVLYSSMSEWPAIDASLAAAGLNRSQYRRWVAQPNGTPHIPAGFDACQWTWTALGRNLDESLCLDSFFGVQAPPPSPLAGLIVEERKAAEEYLSLKAHHASWHPDHIAKALARLVYLRKDVHSAAWHGKLQNGTVVTPHLTSAQLAAGDGWNYRHRRTRYESLGKLTGWAGK